VPVLLISPLSPSTRDFVDVSVGDGAVVDHHPQVALDFAQDSNREPQPLALLLVGGLALAPGFHVPALELGEGLGHDGVLEQLLGLHPLAGVDVRVALAQARSPDLGLFFMARFKSLPPLSALLNSLATFIGTPTFLAKSLECEAAAIRRACLADLLGITIPLMFNYFFNCNFPKSRTKISSPIDVPS